MSVVRFAFPRFIRQAPRYPASQWPRADWRDEECVRVSRDAVCPECQRLYGDHNRVTDEAPTLARACDGRLLKL